MDNWSNWKATTTSTFNNFEKIQIDYDYVMREFYNVVADVPYIELSSERIEDEGGERKC